MKDTKISDTSMLKLRALRFLRREFRFFDCLESFVGAQDCYDNLLEREESRIAQRHA